MFSSKDYPAKSCEKTINDKLGALIKEMYREIILPEYQKYPMTEESELEILGVIVSKYCDWDGEAIKDVAMAAFEDSNFNGVEINLDDEETTDPETVEVVLIEKIRDGGSIHYQDRLNRKYWVWGPASGKVYNDWPNPNGILGFNGTHLVPPYVKEIPVILKIVDKFS